MHRVNLGASELCRVDASDDLPDDSADHLALHRRLQGSVVPECRRHPQRGSSPKQGCRRVQRLQRLRARDPSGEGGDLHCATFKLLWVATQLGHQCSIPPSCLARTVTAPTARTANVTWLQLWLQLSVVHDGSRGSAVVGATR